MKPVIIDRGIYTLGMQWGTGKKTEPSWESTPEGMSLVIGHEGEPFQISHVNNLDFVLKELNTRLKLQLGHRKYVCQECEHEFYLDRELFNEPNFCPYCGNKEIQEAKPDD